MPWRSVAVDDGQPEQAPFMLRDDAILETAESDIAAIVGNRGANPGLDQLLDGGDRGGVRLVEELFAVLDLGAAGGDERRA